MPGEINPARERRFWRFLRDHQVSPPTYPVHPVLSCQKSLTLGILGTLRSYLFLFKPRASGHYGVFSAGWILATYPGLYVLDHTNRAVFR